MIIFVMQQLEKLPESFETFDSPLYTDGSDIGITDCESIEKQVIPGTGLFEGRYFLHGKTTDGKYIKGTLWERSLIDKMEGDMEFFRRKGANIPKFERKPVQKGLVNNYELIISDYIEGLQTFEVFRKYHRESMEEVIKEVIRFAHIHLDYLELSIEQGLPVLSDISIRQLHVDRAGRVYMLDLEPRYTNSSIPILLNVTQSYELLIEEYRNSPQADSVEIEAFLARCKSVVAEYKRGGDE